MALYPSVNRKFCMCCIGVVKLNFKVFKRYEHYAKNVEESKNDVFDEFTSQLIQKKTDKWENQKLMLRHKNKVTVCSDVILENDFKVSKVEKLQNLLQNAIDFNDTTSVIELTKLCVKYKKCPTLSTLINILSICSQKGDKDTIVDITRLCEEIRPDILEENSHFQHYFAQAVWIKGNITKSLDIFEQVYRENPFLRRRIRLMLKSLILDIVSNRSEAALLNIIKFSETISNEFKDFFPLICVWQACFLSEWFTDQNLSISLLERNEGLCAAAHNRIPYVVTMSLRLHRTEVIYRLLEILLKSDMKTQYTGVLVAMLDYQIRRGDLTRCQEIVRWSLKNQVDLPAVHNERFLKLLIETNIAAPKHVATSKRPTDFKF